MEEISDSIRSQYQGPLLEGALQVLIIAYRTRPRSKPNTVFVEVKPDWDNISKLVCDAANESGVLFKDDCQIVDGRCIKLYAPAGVPGWIEIFIRQHPAAAMAQKTASISGSAIWEAMGAA